MLKNKIIVNFAIFVATKEGRTANFVPLPPCLLLLEPGSRMDNTSRIRNTAKNKGWLVTRELAELSRGEGAGADITTVIIPQKEGALTIIRCPFCAVKPFTSQIKLRYRRTRSLSFFVYFLMYYYLSRPLTREVKTKG
jgi:hypothetical protein